MLGIPQVSVYRKPRIVLISSGDELIGIDKPLAPGKIRDANRYTLTAQVEDSGADVLYLGIAADRRDAVQQLLDQAAAQPADLILSSAGVSAGAFDYIKDVIDSEGNPDFWKVNMQPGKPLAFGSYKGIPFFGLPGNPVSAFIGFEVFTRDAIKILAGETIQPRPRILVKIEEDIQSDGREGYLRAFVHKKDDRLTARLTGRQGSDNLFSLIQANPGKCFTNYPRWGKIAPYW